MCMKSLPTLHFAHLLLAGSALSNAAFAPRNFPQGGLMPLVLPELPFAYDALQPYMSKETLEYHHDKHHKAYVDTANKLLEGNPLDGKPLETIVKEAHGKNIPLFNNAAQHYNHSEYWRSLKPNGGGAIPGNLEKALIDSFGSVAKAKEE